MFIIQETIVNRKILAVAVAAAFPLFAFAQAQSFEGWSVTGALGFGQVTPSTSNGTVSAGGTGVGSYSTSASTLTTPTASLGIDYDKAINREWLLGVGMTYLPGNSATANTSTAATVLGNSSTSAGRYWLNNLFTAYVRAGYALDASNLVYAKAGYTSVNNMTDTFTVAETGWLAGVGYRRNFADRWYGFSELIYTSVGPANLPTTLFSSVNPALSNTGTTSATAVEVKVGVGYRF